MRERTEMLGKEGRGGEGRTEGDGGERLNEEGKNGGVGSKRH